jgi:hypothetical protein
MLRAIAGLISVIFVIIVFLLLGLLGLASGKILAHWADFVKGNIRTLGDFFSGVKSGQNKRVERMRGSAGGSLRNRSSLARSLSSLTRSFQRLGTVTTAS